MYVLLPTCYTCHFLHRCLSGGGLFIALVTQLPVKLQSWVRQEAKRGIPHFPVLSGNRNQLWSSSVAAIRHDPATLLGKVSLVYEMLQILENSVFILLHLAPREEELTLSDELGQDLKQALSGQTCVGSARILG